MKIKKNEKVIKLTESDLQRIVKRVLNEQRGTFDYDTIENLKTPSEIFKILDENIGRYVIHNKAPVEAAFMAISETPELFDEVNKLWNRERRSNLIKTVQNAFDITKIWHKQSIMKSLQGLANVSSTSKDAYEEITNVLNQVSGKSIDDAFGDTWN
jgi:frataxin-like iron-binding protein CyaY